MSDTPNIFDKETPVATPTETPTETPTNSFDQLLGGIQREDGTPKYADVPTALNALKESQNYIAQLKAEMEALKTKATEGATMEQVLEALKPKEETPVVETPTPTGITLEDVQALLEQREAQTVTKKNLDMVSSRCLEVFGDKASEMLTSKAAEIGMSPDGLKQIASTSPTAALKLLGIDKKTPSHTPTPNTSVNTATLNPDRNIELQSSMGHVTNKELLGNWNDVVELVNKELEIKG